MLTIHRLSCSFLIAVFLFLISLSTANAHGNKTHGEETASSEHMQEMMALKKKVPEEYQIMERTPVFPDSSSLERGTQLYTESCASCHGKNGNGQGPLANSLPTPPANFLDKKYGDFYNPGEKYWIIGNGSQVTGMPAFGKLSPADRWHLVNYILSLQNNGSK